MSTHSFGTSFSFGGIVAQVTTIQMGGITINMVEDTHLLSAAAFKTFIAGLADAGEITLTLNYEKAKCASLYATVRVNNVVFLLALPDGSTWAGFGLLSNLGLAVPEDDRITQDVTVKISGKPVFTAA